MRARVFVKVWLAAILGFFLLNLILWQGWTSRGFFENADGHDKGGISCRKEMSCCP